jgi:hypothetical protein
VAALGPPYELFIRGLAMLKEQDIPAPSEAGQQRSPKEKLDGPSAKPASSSGWLSRCKSMLDPKLVVAIVVGTVVVQALLLGYYKLGGVDGAADEAVPGGEVTIGEFAFKASPHEVGRVKSARFKLHLALLPDIEPTARLRLAQREFRVQQGVEQLMRQAHSGDFDDPVLSGLKRQLQEQVNETLGIRAVADVIVTDLEIEQSPEADAEGDADAVAHADQALPWNVEGN